MSEAIIVSIVSALVTILTTILTLLSQTNKIQNEISQHNAIQDERIQSLYTTMSELRDEVHSNNELKIRVPVLEEKVSHIERQLAKIGDDCK